MTAFIARIKDSLQAEPKLNPTLDQRLERLAAERQAPVKRKAPVFH